MKIVVHSRKKHAVFVTTQFQTKRNDTDTKTLFCLIYFRFISRSSLSRCEKHSSLTTHLLSNFVNIKPMLVKDMLIMVDSRKFLFVLFLILSVKTKLTHNGPITCTACLEGLSSYCLGMVTTGLL